MSTTSNREAVRALLLERPNQDVSALEIAQVGGLLSSRTRISELRREGMDIRNRCVRDGDVVKSYYKFIPRVPSSLLDLCE